MGFGAETGRQPDGGARRRRVRRSGVRRMHRRRGDRRGAKRAARRQDAQSQIRRHQRRGLGRRPRLRRHHRSQRHAGDESHRAAKRIAALNAARDAQRAVVLATELASGRTPARLSRHSREWRACRRRGESRAPRREHRGRCRRHVVVPDRVQPAARSGDHRRSAYRPAARAHGRARRLRRPRHRSAHRVCDGRALSERRAVARVARRGARRAAADRAQRDRGADA